MNLQPSLCRSARVLTVVLLMAGSALACQQVVARLGPTPELARERAGVALGALAARFGPTDLEPALLRFRAKVGSASLVPSWVYDDASLWPSRRGDTRLAGYRGTPGPHGYRMTLGPVPPVPRQAGHYRRVLSLQKLSDGEFEWRVRDELALGSLATEDAAHSLASALRAVENTPDHGVRPALAAAFPRASRVMGRLWSLYALKLMPDSERGTGVVFISRLEPKRFAAGYPHYARFLKKYAMRLRFQFEARDGETLWWQVEGYDGRWTLSFRVQDGHLAPLRGPPGARMPQRLTLRTRFSTKSGLFRVGLRDLEAEVDLIDAPRRKAFQARFNRRPKWRLPFLVQPFLKASLRRPFEGDGAWLSFALEETEGGGTFVQRDYRLAVQESWVVRWLGDFAGGLLVDFRRDAEQEADRYSGELLQALRADVVALATPARALSNSPVERP